MRVSAVVGAVHGQGVALAPDVELSEACTLSLERGASITLSLHDYVRVHIVGPALAQLLPEGEPAVLLREGLVTLDVAPRGARAITSAFWLATPTLRLDVPDSVRVAIRAFPDSASELSVVSGYLTVSQPRQPLAVPAGSSVCVSLVQAKLVPLHMATLELALASLSKARSCAPAARTSDDALERAHHSAAAAVAAAAEREREQLAEHHRQVSVDAGAALQLREQLAHLGAELTHLSDLSQALRAQHAARALAVPRAR
ncbi:MAG: hypothetical protein JWN04_4083 [Myxococcaceae bacterium]|nr:hypothetical protein [Myxococcaceae bacterium]